jgi:hypothetical protein
MNEDFADEMAGRLTVLMASSLVTLACAAVASSEAVGSTNIARVEKDATEAGGATM